MHTASLPWPCPSQVLLLSFRDKFPETSLTLLPFLCISSSGPCSENRPIKLWVSDTEDTKSSSQTVHYQF